MYTVFSNTKIALKAVNPQHFGAITSFTTESVVRENTLHNVTSLCMPSQHFLIWRCGDVVIDFTHVI